MLPAFEWKGDHLLLLDQRYLPWEEKYLKLRSLEEVARAIEKMKVRGAPAIGCVAAYGVVLALREGRSLEEAIGRLSRTRPTAVNLFWALERMKRAGEDPAAAEKEARAIEEEDYQANLKMGELGSELIPEGVNVLTHCNAGALATAGYGTAVGVIRRAWEKGKVKKVFVDETRPYLQGARLTTWEFLKLGIPTVLITDNMAGHFISRGEIGAIVVGADRIAANGDVANKIGTYTLSVLAKEHGVKFFVAAPTSTLDLKTPTGSQIPIEERSRDEVIFINGRNIAPLEVEVRHPAFDITPASHITAIITEMGVIYPPFEEGLRRLLNDTGH